jgi:hypothetical protein
MRFISGKLRLLVNGVETDKEFEMVKTQIEEKIISQDENNSSFCTEDIKVFKNNRKEFLDNTLRENRKLRAKVAKRISKNIVKRSVVSDSDLFSSFIKRQNEKGMDSKSKGVSSYPRCVEKFVAYSGIDIIRDIGTITIKQLSDALIDFNEKIKQEVNEVKQEIGGEIDLDKLFYGKIRHMQTSTNEWFLFAGRSDRDDPNHLYLSYNDKSHSVVVGRRK